MSFGPWFPLTSLGVSQHAPDIAAAVQIKREEGLAVFPAGKSAMVFYFFAETSTAAALKTLFPDELETPGIRGQGPLRFRLWEGTEGRAALEQLYFEFTERFGAPPFFHASTSSPGDLEAEKGDAS